MDTQQLKTVVKLGEMVQVNIKKCMPPQGGKWGETMLVFVEFNNKEYSVYFKEKDFNKAVEGNLLSGAVKEYSGTLYFEWFLLNDGSDPKEAVETDMDDTMKVAEQVFATKNEPLPDFLQPEPPQREDPVPGRIMRGMCGNQAATLLSNMLKRETSDVNSVVATHQELARAIYDAEREWYETGN